MFLNHNNWLHSSQALSWASYAQQPALITAAAHPLYNVYKVQTLQTGDICKAAGELKLKSFKARHQTKYYSMMFLFVHHHRLIHDTRQCL